jgi:putative ABC transport system permease protein
MLRQTMVITLIYIRSLPQRFGASLASAVGVAGVVAVMVAVLSIGEGFRETLKNTGSPDSVLVLRSGSDTELSSVLSLDATRIIANGPGLAQTATGPVASAEVFAIVDLLKRSTGTKANVPLRGVQSAAFDVRRRVKIIEGRPFEPGKNEIIAGSGARAQFSGVDLGSTLRLGEVQWTVVGIFAAEGSASESELWCDVKVLQPAYRRGGSFQSVYARLESPEQFDTFKDALMDDPRLGVKVVREQDFYAAQSQMLSGIVMGLGSLVTIIMGVGAIFGALNTMYSAVASRAREIATLRALGFGSVPVVLSVLAESLVLSLAGGLIGGLGAYFAFNGYQAATLNWQSFSQVVFSFRVTPGLMLAGLAASLIMGLLGGLLPAVRAARLPIATALRQL